MGKTLSTSGRVRNKFFIHCCMLVFKVFFYSY